MPRKPRNLEDQGLYHVYNRGNECQDIYRDSDDFSAFLESLRVAKERFKVDIFHYCLMTNHFHLLIKVQKGPDLALMMHLLQRKYAWHMKKKYAFMGHLYQGRYKSPRIAEDSYYLQCGRYIERNPVEANMVKYAYDYRYSSAAFYALGRTDSIVTSNDFYLEMGRTPEERRLAYREYLQMNSPYGDLVDKVFKG